MQKKIMFIKQSLIVFEFNSNCNKINVKKISKQFHIIYSIVVHSFNSCKWTLKLFFFFKFYVTHDWFLLNFCNFTESKWFGKKQCESNYQNKNRHLMLQVLFTEIKYLFIFLFWIVLRELHALITVCIIVSVMTWVENLLSRSNYLTTLMCFVIESNQINNFLRDYHILKVYPPTFHIEVCCCCCIFILNSSNRIKLNYIAFK